LLPEGGGYLLLDQAQTNLFGAIDSKSSCATTVFTKKNISSPSQSKGQGSDKNDPWQKQEIEPHQIISVVPITNFTMLPS
jgi:hypothetical protein